MKMAVFWTVAAVDWYKLTDVSEVCTASCNRAIKHSHSPDDGGSADL
jgi:hypothetical protein